MAGTAPSSSDCVAYYKLEDLTDSSGNGNTLTNSGATSTTGIINKGYSFVTNDYLTAGDKLSFANAGVDTAFSISLWVNVATWNQTGTLISRYSALGREYMVLIYNNLIYFALYQGNTYIGRSGSVSAQPTGEFVNIIVTYDGSETNAGCEIWIDNSQVDTTNVTSGNYTGMYDVAGSMQIGRRPSELYLAGTIDEIGFFDIELTADNKTFLYQGGSPGSAQQYPFTSGWSIKVNIGDSWKAVTAIKQNIGDTWKTVSAVKQNIGDTWKTI